MKPTIYLRRFALAGSVAATLTGCATARVTTDWDRSARFADYRTYTWMDTPRMQAMERATLFDRRLRSAVEAELATKGYRRSDGNGDADVLLAYHAGVQDKLDVQQWGTFGRQWDVRDYQQGTLVIDVVDAKRMALVWRGTASGEMNGRDPSAEKLAKAVHKMFAAFPAS